MKVPNSATNLGKAIRRLCKDGEDDIRLARAMADVVVGQMLPEGVVKGGSYRDEESSINVYSRGDVYLVTSANMANYIGFRLCCSAGLQ